MAASFGINFPSSLYFVYTVCYSQGLPAAICRRIDSMAVNAAPHRGERYSALTHDIFGDRFPCVVIPVALYNVHPNNEQSSCTMPGLSTARATRVAIEA